MSKIKKEGIIVIIIVILILITNNIIQKYISDEIYEIKCMLIELKIFLNKEKDEEKLKEEVNKLKDKWEKSKENLSLIIEHQELEKIDNNIQDIKYMTKNKLKNRTNMKIEKTINLLNELNCKYEINIGNIF